MSSSQKASLLKGKYLITSSIFSTVFHFEFCLHAIRPLVWVLMPMNIAIVTGIPFMLLRAKVKKFGAILIMGGFIMRSSGLMSRFW